MRLIAVVGAKQSGKTTASALLVDQGFTRVRFADGLKRMLRAMGLTEAQVDGDEKETPCALLGGKTPRWAMQRLGTEWGRKLIDPALWARITRNEIIAHMVANPHARIVVDDCRHPNEEKLIRQLGGSLWMVRRPDIEVSMTPLDKWLVRRGLSKKAHASETYWPDFKVDVEIMNDRTLDDFARIVVATAQSIPVMEVA